MTSFFSISKTTCVRIVGVATNDAEYMISYLSSIHYLAVSSSEKDLIQKNVFLSDFLLVGIVVNVVLLRSFWCKKVRFSGLNLFLNVLKTDRKSYILRRLVQHPQT